MPETCRPDPATGKRRTWFSPSAHPAVLQSGNSNSRPAPMGGVERLPPNRLHEVWMCGGAPRSGITTIRVPTGTRS